MQPLHSAKELRDLQIILIDEPGAVFFRSGDINDTQLSEILLNGGLTSDRLLYVRYRQHEKFPGPWYMRLEGY